MKMIYGRGSDRIDLTPAVTEMTWSSSRGQIAQVCQAKIRNAPPLGIAGYLMVFAKEQKLRDQFFHGPVVEWNRDEKTGEVSVTAYELSWYLQKNDVQRPYINGDVGKELGRIIKAAGISFECPSFGCRLKERMSTQSYTSLYTQLTEEAYDKTGIRYFVQHERDKLKVLAEGNNPYVPVFKAAMLEASSMGESMEELYTVVTVQRYKDDKLASSVSKENSGAVKRYGRMQKIIEAGKDDNLATIANNQLKRLSELSRTREITVRFTDPAIAKLRAGWRVDILERNGKQTQWIVTSISAQSKGMEYMMDLSLESR
ncbi:hypothetical protein ACEU2D_20040 [Brevibacillus laterosporus]|uniref:XkdQ/YqbQ family protein n=1 Tax=Brevibacillus laterosporus TaxID=1465 RepID=UPI0035A73709